jgi:hypothetical protein
MPPENAISSVIIVAFAAHKFLLLIRLEELQVMRYSQFTCVTANAPFLSCKEGVQYNTQGDTDTVPLQVFLHLPYAPSCLWFCAPFVLVPSNGVFGRRRNSPPRLPHLEGSFFGLIV